jgi:4-amino-4-deoxy-L-arabinose transferase-like glycosyltransferase
VAPIARRPVVHGVLVALLLAAYWSMAISAAARKSPAFDELAHLTAGYSYWVTGDYRLHAENGLLPQKWAALPLVFADERFPALDQPAWRQSNVWALGYQFFYLAGNDLESMLALGRAMIALLGVVLGAVVYAWSRSLFGRRGGLISLTLYAFSPALLAHGALVTSDMSLTLFLFASVWAIWALTHRIDLFNLLAASAAVTAALLSKVSGLAVIPIAVTLVALRTRFGPGVAISFGAEKRAERLWPRLLAMVVSLAAAAAVVSAIIWAVYGFRYSAFADQPAGQDRFYEDWGELRSDPTATGAVVRWLRDRRALPEAYLYGLAFISKVSPGRPAFLNGEVRRGGWWTFFPYAAAVKTPLPLFGLLLLGALAASIGLRRRDLCAEALPSLYQTIPLWVLVGVYGGLAVESRLNFGHRYVLPIYPAMLVLAGAASSWLTRRRAAAGAAVLALLALYVGDSLHIRPDYLAYLNPLAGGPAQGWRHLVDSSLDWGQDLPALKLWLDRNAGIQAVYLSYFGTGRPDRYGIRAKRLPSYIDDRTERRPYSPTAGVYCVSATMLQSLFSPAFGRWRPSYERIYRQLRAEVENADGDAIDAPPGTSASSFAERFALFDQFRFARLCAFLRRRGPDDEVGYSILIYRLTAQEIHEALDAPPAELVPDA